MRNPVACVLIASFLALGDAITDGAMAAPAEALSISDMMKIRHLHFLRMSPDGRHVAFVIAEADFPRNAYRFTLKIVDTQSGKLQEIENGQVSQQPCWAPNGKEIAFLRGDGKSDSLLVLRMGDTESREAIADMPRRADSLSWSPTGDMVAFLAASGSNQKRETPVDTVYENGAVTSDSLYFADIAIGKVEPAGNATGHTSEYAWSPDGTRIVYVQQPTARKSDTDNTDLWLLDIASGESSPLVQQAGGDTQPQWSPDGDKVVFFSKQGNGDYFQPYVPCVVSAAGENTRPLVKHDAANCRFRLDQNRLFLQMADLCTWQPAMGFFGTYIRLASKLVRPSKSPHWRA